MGALVLEFEEFRPLHPLRGGAGGFCVCGIIAGMDEKPITHFNPGPMPLCKHCVHAQSRADAHLCTITGRVSYFGWVEFLREVGADDDVS